MTPGPALLGIDGGGTSTLAWLADAGGDVLGRGRAGPSNAKAVGPAKAREAIGRAIALAFDDAGLDPSPVAVACLGLAGFDRPDDREILSGWGKAGGWADRLVLVNDGDLILAAGTPEGWGLGAIAGTGSIAVARTHDGRKARAGGWGPLFSDEGSAYVVVLAALRLILRRADGRSPRPDGDDPLAGRLCAAFGVAEPSAIVSAIYTPEYDRTRIAGLAPIVLSAAKDDPSLVPILLEPAGADLAEMVSAAARTLGWAPGPVPLALAGSFLLGAGDVSRALVEGLRVAGFDAQATPVPDPVRGALVLAGRALREEKAP
jgi:N-acetylglucosamine kinase-like BadF-type ATPase